MILKVSLHTRFTIWITILIFVLVCATLYVIQTREVATVFEESKNKGLLMAKNLADLNLRWLMFNDIEPIQSTIQEQINAKLLYIVFFDRFATALVYNREIADRKEIFCCSHLQGDIRPESVFAQTDQCLRREKNPKGAGARNPDLCQGVDGQVGIGQDRPFAWRTCGPRSGGPGLS